MFILHTSNRTEDLLRQLGAVLLHDPQKNPFQKEIFLIQSQGMERVVSQNLADQFGVFCNFEFFLPLKFLLYSADLLGLGISPDGFDRNVLTWRIESLLRNSEGVIYQPLHRFLQGDNLPRKRYQLAKKLANIFDQYQLMRGEMILGWQEGSKSTKESASEAWQMDLWRRLIAQPDGETHRTILFKRVIDYLEQGAEDLTAILPKRVSIFGVHTLPPLFLRYLSALALHMNVHLYLLSPCRHYWGGIRGDKLLLREALQKGVAFVEGEGGHPLLASLGQQGRELQNIMLDDVEFHLEIPSWHDPVAAAQECGRDPLFLEKIQHDILEGQITPAIENAFDADESIRVVSTYSRWRELEVLHEHLKQITENNPQLELRDIVVMAPDIGQYAPLIPAAFADMQFSIADRSLQKRNQAFAAFSLFLDLFIGRFGRSEVLEVLHHEIVAERFDLSAKELDEINQWTELAAIRWGLSTLQRKEMGFEFDEATFEMGLDRLLMGFMIESDQFVDGILPCKGIEGKSAAALGGLCQFISLLDQAERDFRMTHSLGRWSELLVQAMEELLIDDGSKDVAELRSLLAELPESEHFTGEEEIDFAVIREWFTSSMKESRSSAGFMRGQLTFCSMLPMRSIPFEVICLLGLDDGVFPKSDNANTFDLIAAGHRAGDRSPRNDDRYQFLEAILAARRVLYLSYVGCSEKSGERLPPSVVVSEFVDLLTSEYGVKEVITEHPLYPFNSRYFDGQSKQLFSYSADNFAVAKKRQSQEKKEPAPLAPFSWWQGVLESETPSAVSPNALFAFFNNPPAWFVRNVLAIELQIESAAEEDRENFALDPLERYFVNHRLFHKEMAGENSAELLQTLQAEGSWPLGTAGKLAFDSHLEDIKNFTERVKEQGIGGPKKDITIDIGPSDGAAGLSLAGTLSGLYEGGSLILRFGNLRGRDLLRAWLQHQLTGIAGISEATWLISNDRVISFKGKTRYDEAEYNPGLASLIRLFLSGQRRALPLLIEPAFAYAKRALAPERKNSLDPMESALKTARDLIEKGWEQEVKLLLGDGELSSVLGEEFVEFSEKIMKPIYEQGINPAEIV